MNIFDPQVSGSLSVSGSSEISGDLRVLGTLFATISGTAENAVSTSHAAAYTLTSSFHQFTSSYTTGAFTGSFGGNGAGLYDIPASGVTGLNLTRIADGSATASISQADGLRINTNTELTGSLKISNINLGSDKVILVNVTDSGGKYFIDGVRSPILSLIKGFTYKFLFPNIGAHPFRFSTTNDGTHNGGTVYTTGVTTGSTPDYIQIEVTDSTPSTLYYFCTSHHMMGNGIGVYSDLLNVEADRQVVYINPSIIATTGSNTFIGTETISGSLSVTGSVNITGSISLNGQAIGTGKLDEVVFNSYTSSNDTTNSLQNGRLDLLETSTSSLNTFTSSTNNRLNTVETYTGSLNTRLDIIETSTSSLNTFSSSINNRVGIIETSTASLNIFTSSASSRLLSIETSTASLNIFTSSTNNKLSAIESTTSSLNSYTASNNTRLDVIEGTTGSLNTFTSSTSNKLSAIETSTSSLNLFTSSTNLSLNSVLTSTASLNTYTSSNNTNINAIHTATSSLNTFSSSILNAIEVTGSNLTIKGDLLVKGTTTQIDSTTLNIGDNIISLNGTATNNAGLVVQDASGASIVSGSLLWDTSTDFWKAGKLGSEERIILVNEYNTFSTSIDSRATSLQTATSSLNSYTSSNTSNINAIHTSTSSLNTFTSSANGRLDSLETSTGSLNTYTSSTNTRLGVIESTTGSLNTFTSSADSRLNAVETSTSSLNTFSSSTNDKLSSLESASSSIRTDFNSYTSSNNTVESTQNGRLSALETTTGSLNTYTSSNTTNINAIHTATSSLNSFTSSINTTVKNKLNADGVISGSIQVEITGTTGYSTFSGSIATTDSTQNDRIAALESMTGSYATTGSSNIVGNQTITGSVYITQNLTVLGSSSFLYLTASQLAVSSSTISVNVFEPAERFGGLKVYDSGSLSHQATASLLWDSQNNHWIYQNAYVGGYSGGMLISGPRNTGALGDEAGTIANVVMKGQGGDHITGSNITDTGTKVSINSNTEVTGTLKVTENITSPNITAIETSTSSLNTFSSSILAAVELTGSNLTVKGNLLVKGTTTNVNTTTLDVDNNLINLNGTGATLAGLRVKDTTAPNQVSGSLLWDATNDYWIAGQLGSEQRLVRETEFNNAVNRVDSLEISTASLNTFTSSAASRLSSLETASGSIRTDFNSYTSSNNTTNNTQNSRLTSIESTTGSLNTYTSSNTTNINAIHTATSSLNSYTSSNNTTISSLNSYTSSNTTNINAIHTATGSLNSFTNSFNSAFSLSGADVTVRGNFTVSGTTTTVNSTTVAIGDNIIQLNGSGATNAGIVVRDATSPTTTSGSLLWDTTNDKWIAGPLGAEDDVVLRTATQTLTNKTINASQLVDASVTNTKLANSSFNIGTTSISLGRTSSAQTLSGVSIDGTVTKTLASGVGENFLYANVGSDDYVRVRGGSDSYNTGWIEIATSDDGTEPIYVRQYTGVFTTVARTATLLDGSGNTSFPGTINGLTVSSGTITSGTWNGTAIANAYLANSSFFVGTTSISLGRSSASQTLTGVSIDGNAGTVTNGVYTSGDQTIGGAKTFSSNITNSATADWYMYGFGARGASSGQYGMGLASDIANRTLSFHVPNHTAYSSSGAVPKFGWYSNGAVELMSLQSATGNLVVTGTIAASNLSGTNTGDQTTISGNAGSATILQTARTIGGVSFNGSANIDLPGVNTSGNQNTTGNANTATTLQTARTIGGVSFNGSANIDLPGVNTTGNQNTSGTASNITAFTINQNVGTANTPTFAGLTVGAGLATGRSSWGAPTNANIILTSSASDSTGNCGIEFRSGNNFPSDGASIYFENNASGGASERAKLTIRVENDAEDFMELRAGNITLNSNTISAGGQNPSIIFQNSGTTISSISSTGVYNGSISGNAATVTNGVYTNGSYSDPSWITLLAGSKINGAVASATNATAAANISLTSLGNGSVNVNNGSSAVYRNENGSGAALSYSPVFHAGAGDTMWQIQGTYGTSGNGTFYFRQGYNGSWGNWLTMLSSANYNSYSPTLTGTGASGNWGINITGNAATATSADQIDGVGFRNTGSNEGVNAQSLDSNGMTYVTNVDGSSTNLTGNATDGALYSQIYSSSWQHQIYGDYRTGIMYARGKNNGTWQSWKRVALSNSTTFSNVSSVSFTHNLGTANLTAQVFDSSNNMFFPSEINITSTTVTVTFAANRTGRLVVTG
jgi:hypothetical protein